MSFLLASFCLIVAIPEPAVAKNITTYRGMNYGFVSEPYGRGTFGILWTCLTTLFLCTWTVQHLNIAGPNDSSLKKSLRKMKWMIITAIVPEYTTYTALYQYCQARQTVVIITTVSGYEWWTMTHGFYAIMGGLVVEIADGKRYTFNWIDLLWLWQHRIIDLPHVEEKDIKDRNKADGLVKGLACTQAVWFLIQSVGRVSQGLPFTTLEIGIIPMVACTFLTYFIWWGKPLDLETTTIIMAPTITEDFVLNYKPQHRMSMLPDYSGQRIPNELSYDYWYDYKDQKHYTTDMKDLVLTVLGVPFCAFHIVACNFCFPTYTEMIMWRVCALCAVGSLVLGLLITIFPCKNTWCMDTLTDSLGGIHILSRLFILVEAFIGLRSLPPGVFETVNWSLYIPHLHSANDYIRHQATREMFYTNC